MCFDIVTNLPRFTQDCSTNLVARFWHFISAVASAYYRNSESYERQVMR